MYIRRLTKKLIPVMLGIVMILLYAAPAAAQGPVIKGTPDGQNKTVAMDEHFYSGSLEPSFMSDSVLVKTDSFGMHFTGAYHYGSALVLAAYRLGDYNRFTFSVDMLSTNNGFIYCGFGGESPSTTVSKFDFNLSIASGVAAIYEMGGMDSWTNRGVTQLSNALAAGKVTDFAVTLRKISGNTFSLTMEILEEGKAVVTTDFGTTIRMEHPDGYFCMWGGINEIFSLRDFKVYDSPDHLAFSDDFTASSLTYGDEAVGDSFWHTNESRFTRDEIFIARDAGPIFGKAGDTITAKNPLTACDQVSTPYELSFKAQLGELQENAIFGFYLGADSPGDLRNSTIVGVSATQDGFARVNLIKNGSAVDFGDDLIPLSVLNIGGPSIDFEASVSSDYTLTARIAGVLFIFNDIKYDGYWGICDYSLDGVSASDVRVDEAKLIRNTYTPCDQPDLSNDFGGIRLTQDGVEEYYISDRTYYMGPGVSLRPKGAFTPEPSLYFENSGSYSSFGPKKPYTDFILQFDVRMVSEGHNSQWFGVNFGKDSYATIPDRYSGIYFEYYAWGVDPCTYMTTNQCSFADGSKTQKIEDYHFYKDQDTKYNFMFVAKNRTVYVYFKEDSEDISQLGICRAVIPDINTAGYVTIFGVSGLSFDIFNYKLTNIAPEATGDSAIALRESFDGAVSDKLQTEGAAAVNDGAMKLSGGSLGMKESSRYYIADFTLLGTGTDLTVSLPGENSLTLSGDLQKVTVHEGEKETEFDISGYRLSDYVNTDFELIVQYDALSLAAKGVYEPADRLSAPIVEYTFSAPVGDGRLSWTSDNAAIDDISVYTLDSTFAAAKVSFEQDPNNTDIWQPKPVAHAADSEAQTPGQSDPAEQTPSSPEENEGLPTLFIILYSVIGAVILILLGVIIGMSVKKKKKSNASAPKAPSDKA
ncbi:MAG: hypothetical protein IJS22_08110 [Lachnospiraceae bacterium]|nr:hypothetical protein [Lachnospiraceae bacterium]